MASPATLAHPAATPRETEGVYTDTAVRLFALAAVLWGVVGMLVGVIIAAQLTWPQLNFGIPWRSYGRLRPLHIRLSALRYLLNQRCVFFPALRSVFAPGFQVLILSKG